MTVGVVVVEHANAAWTHAAESSAYAQTVAPASVVRVGGGDQSEVLLEGVSQLDTEYFIRLDGDDLLHPQFIEKTLAAIGDADFAATGVQMFGAQSGGWVPAAFPPIALRDGNPYAGTALIRRSSYDRAGGYCSKDGMYCDFGLWLEFERLGMRGVVVEERLFFYRRHEENHSTTSSPEERAALRASVLESHPPAPYPAPELSVVIPLRQGDSPAIALRSLDVAAEIIVARDDGRGANWARNRGFKLVRTPYVLFCDGDIKWRPGGIAKLLACLKGSPEASYCYGSYIRGGLKVGGGAFDAERLRENNYISTMSVVRTEHFPGFDDEIRRLQDWDVWLTMLSEGYVGVDCGEVVFDTAKTQGITFGCDLSWDDARSIVAGKHGIP